MKTTVTVRVASKDKPLKVHVYASVERVDLTRGEMRKVKAALADGIVDVLRTKLPYGTFSVLDIKVGS